MRKIIFLLSLTLLFSLVFASESSLTSFGFNEIDLDKANSVDCETINIDVNGEGNAILSIYASFVGQKGDNTFASVEFNDSRRVILWPENFDCGNYCVARVFVPELKEGAVETKICLNAGGKSTATIFEKSRVGFYETPVLTIENISPKKIFLGERVEMKIRVKNSGDESADVFVQFIEEDLRSFIEITSFDIVEGDSTASVTLAPGETRNFTYYIKPTKLGSYNLPSAVLFFDNIFGERQKIISNHPQLIVKSPEKIDLVLSSSSIEENEATFKAIITNNHGEAVSVNLSLFPKDLFEDPDMNVLVGALAKKEIEIKTKELQPGEYSVLVQVDDEGIEYVSNSISFLVIDNDYAFEITATIFLILVGLIIFGLIYFSKY
jgi:hypothetical protein